MKKIICLLVVSFGASIFVGPAQGAIYGEGNTKCQAYTGRIAYAETFASESLAPISLTDSKIVAVDSWIRGYLSNRANRTESIKQTIKKIRTLCLQQPQSTVGQVLIDLRR